MAGKSSKTEVITLRVPVDLASELKRLAAGGNASVSSVVIGRTQAVPLLHKQIAELNAALDAANEDIKRLKQDVAAKGTRLDLVTKALTAAQHARAGREESAGARPTIAGKLLGNPVLKSAVPERVTGAVEWCGLKGLDKPRKQ